MYKVQFKSHNGTQSWTSFGSYGSEGVALVNAARAAVKYFMVRVLAPDGAVVWSG